MTYKLVLENMRYKPMRSLLSVLLIGVPVTLILCLVGISQGLLEDSARRQQGVGADIFVRPRSSSFLTLSGAPLPEQLVDYVQSRPHVTLATGMVTQPIEPAPLWIGGVDLPAFSRMSGGFRFVEGRQIDGPDQIIIDTFFARQRGVHAGDTIKVLNRDWRVAGVYEPGKLAHLILPIRVLQDLMSNKGKVSQIFAKVDDPAVIPSVIADLKANLIDYPIYSMQELTSLYTIQNVGGVKEFINVMLGIGVVIGFAVVCLSMYMAVLQRTREIGILKSLGASRWFILRSILVESVVMAIGGTILGIGLSFGARWLILRLVPASITQAIVVDWWPRVAVITVIGALLGALYPGLSAARKDPIEALAYE